MHRRNHVVASPNCTSLSPSNLMIPIYRDVLRLQRPADVNDDASDRILRIPIGESHRRFHRDQKQRDRSVAPMRHSYHLTAADQARLFAVACIRIVGWFYSEPSESVEAVARNRGMRVTRSIKL